MSQPEVPTDSPYSLLFRAMKALHMSAECLTEVDYETAFCVELEQDIETFLQSKLRDME